MSTHAVYVDPEDIRRKVGGPTGTDADEEVAFAAISGSRWVDHWLGINAASPGTSIEDVPVVEPVAVTIAPVDPRVSNAALVAGIRHIRSADVPFSVAGGFGDLATRIRADIPEAAMLLRGLRDSWGVA